MISPKNEKNSSYSSFPPELLKTIKEAFEESFPEAAKTGEFFTHGQIHKGELVLRVGYLKENTITQVNFDTSIEVTEETQDPNELLDELVVGTKELFLNYFKDQNLENFSYYWNPIPVSKAHTVFYKYDGTNSKLEEQANKILGEVDSEKALIHGGMEESEEIEKIVETLQATEFKF